MHLYPVNGELRLLKLLSASPFTASKLNVASLSDIGLQRRGSVNQDSILTADLPDGQLFAVADGMGGHKAGELASRLALDSFLKSLEQPRGTLLQRAVYAAESANQAVYQQAVGELSGMGTTLLAAIVARGTLYITHIGDSRAYLLRGETLFRLTDDHSWVADQLRAGELTPEQARNHRWRNVVSNALGGEERVRLELLQLPLQSGDRLLLCTDGLYVPVSEHRLLTVLSLPRAPEGLVQMLIDMANQAGGPDNVSAVIVDVLDLGVALPQEAPGRWHDGPLYAEQLLSELRQGTPINYLFLASIYLTLLLLALVPTYRAQVAVIGLVTLGVLTVYSRHWHTAEVPVLRPEAAITLQTPEGRAKADSKH